LCVRWPAAHLPTPALCLTPPKSRAPDRRPPLFASPTGYHRGPGRKRRGAGWSNVFVALPPLWKPERASCAAPGVEPLHFYLFGRAPGGAAAGAGAGALPNRA
jgi:hypothetical protein